jgi:Protein of unknown function (DUF4231)
MPETILPGRINSEIAFSEKWAKIQGFSYYALAVLKVFAAGSIPYLLTIGPSKTYNIKLIIGVLGVLVAISETFTTSFSLRKRFEDKRLECEALKSEAYLYRGKVGVYANDATRDAALIAITEKIIARRVRSWAGRESGREKSSKGTGS